MSSEVYMAKPLSEWGGNFEGGVKDITLCVTEDCNLRCKYCYMTGKNNKKTMSFEIAKKFINHILDSDISKEESSVVWNFIGGEPFIEIELIDKISDYIKYKMFTLNHKWFDSYRFNFATNGILYDSEKVQKYINKNRGHISIGISIDGNKEKHDLQRVYEDGTGSYDDVMRNAKLWLKQFPNVGTKATFAKGDLIYLKDSIISLWNNGIKDVSANLVFEDVWEDGDDEIFENQLNELGDYILENKLWNDCWVRFFDPYIGFKNSKEAISKSVCGSGKMLAIDCDGKFYPCIRFLDFSLNKRKGICTGNYECGIDKNKLVPFEKLNLETISDQECKSCEVATGCTYCTGFNYDEYGTIFRRTKYICKMHKANVRANKRFWRKYSELTGNKSPRENFEKKEDSKFLKIMLSDKIISSCLYDVKIDKNNFNVMSSELIEKAIKFAKENEYKLVLLGEKENENLTEYYAKILDAKSQNRDDKTISIYNNYDYMPSNKGQNCILVIDKEDIHKLSDYVNDIWKIEDRINLILRNIENWSEDDLLEYSKELSKIEKNISDNRGKEINVISDLINQSEYNKCDAGESTITLAPDGRFYICPAFYYDKIDKPIGDIENGLDREFIENIILDNVKSCSQCDSYQCKQCKYLNKKYTNEYSVPYNQQCVISKLESKQVRINKL